MENIKAKRLEKLAEIRSLIDADVAEFNTLLGEGKSTAEIDAKTAEHKKEYNKLKELTVYDEFLSNPNPMYAAVSSPVYYALGIKDERDDGVVSYRKVIDDVKKRVDLEKFIEFGKIDKSIRYEVEVFNHRLTLRAAEELSFTPEEIATISDKHHMSDAARKRFAEETTAEKIPTSNTSIVNQMQAIVDKILFIDDGAGKNKVKCLSCDAKFLVMTYTKKSKDMLFMKTGSTSDVFDSLLQGMYRILAGKSYSLEYKADKLKVAAPAVTPAIALAPAPAPTATEPTVTEPTATEPTATETAAAASVTADVAKTTGKKSGKKGDKAVAA